MSQGIENIFMSPSKAQRIKELNKKTDEGLLALREFYELYGLVGHDAIQDKIIPQYKTKYLEIINEPEEVDITYVPATRTRRKRGEGEGEEGAGGEDEEPPADDKPPNHAPDRDKIAEDAISAAENFHNTHLKRPK